MALLTPEVLKAALSSKLHGLHRDAVPAVSEARCAWLIEPIVRNFVLAAEGAPCDAGLVMTDDYATTFPEESTARLFHILNKYEDQAVLLPIDIKCVNPELFPWEQGAFCKYVIGMSEAQIKCALIIITSPAAPHLVAMVPRQFLTRNDHTVSGGFKRHFRSLPTFNEDVEPFPMEISPFIMPITFLAAGLEEFKKFYYETSRGWRNPYSGVQVDDLTLPELHSVQLLRPSATSRLNDLSVEMAIWSAFHQHSRDYHVERLMIQPSVGDFQIVHLATGTRMIVEMKNNVCKFDEVSGVLTHDAYLPGWPTRYFSALSQWDYLLSIFKASDGSKLAFIVSRDSLPRHWVDSDAQQLEWRLEQEMIDRNLIKWQEDDLNVFVRGSVAVFDERINSGLGLRATKSYPFIPLNERETELLLGDEAYREAMQEPLRPDDDYVFGAGLSQLQGDLLHERLLKRQCSERRFGWIYRLGLHPTASHAYAPGVWASDKPPSFFDLDPQTPMLCLNFADIDTVDELNPRIRHRTQFYQATHGVGTSLYVLLPFEPSLAGHGLNYYMVPSTALDGDGKMAENNEKAIKHGHYSRKKDFVLLSDESVTVYACPEDECVAFIDCLCREWSNPFPDASTSFRAPGRFGSKFLDEAMVSKAEIIRRLLDMENGCTLWNHVISTTA